MCSKKMSKILLLLASAKKQCIDSFENMHQNILKHLEKMVCVSKMVKLNELKIFIYNIDVFVKYEKTEKYRIFLI